MQHDHLFDYDDYKKYLNDRLDSNPGGRGRRSQFARSINCQTAYISSVLRGKGHFTLEQGEAINHFFSHTETESDFFSLLLQFQRAGTELLRKRIKRHLDKIKEGRFNLETRLNVCQELSQEDQAIFYSQWYYTAIHALVSIPGYQSVPKIASYLGLSPALVSKAIEFLLRVGLLTTTKGNLALGKSHTHLGADSPFVSRHHNNWRVMAIKKLEGDRQDNLHYSSVITLSAQDCKKIKEMLVSVIKESKQIIRDSKEETLQCFSIDFFSI